jgi:hypothetical protein
MAFETPIRGGINPNVATDTTLYTAAAASVVFVTACNRTELGLLIRIAIRPLGATLAVTHYDLYDTILPARDTLTRGPFSLLATDVITVRTDTADVTFRYDGWT